MTRTFVEVRLSRPVRLDGIARAAGELVSVAASTAATMIASGHARLTDIADLALLLDARRPAASPARDLPRLLHRRS